MQVGFHTAMGDGCFAFHLEQLRETGWSCTPKRSCTQGRIRVPFWAVQGLVEHSLEEVQILML